MLAVPGWASPPKSKGCVRRGKSLANVEARAVARCGDVHGCTLRQQKQLSRLADGYADKCVTLNEVQVLGSHNSYHIEPKPDLMAALLALLPVFEQIQYTHLPLDQQFETQGIRQVEIDVWADPQGGLYRERKALIKIGQDPESHLPELDQPGFKVLHILDVDFETTCLTFKDCLQTIKTWSDAHPSHMPIMIQIEAKDDGTPDIFGPGFAIPPKIGPAEFDALDAEIRSVFPPERMITPDDVRHDASTLEYAVKNRGWPTLGASRGKVLFTLDNEGKRIDYLTGHPNLAGRVLFTNANPGDPDAAFVKRNDPIGDTDIPQLVAAGYVVRTRADADTLEARAGNTGPRDAALASGAQWVSTDYEAPDPRFGTGYFVEIPGGMPARCNPVDGPPGCRAFAIERLP